MDEGKIYLICVNKIQSLNIINLSNKKVGVGMYHLFHDGAVIVCCVSSLIISLIALYNSSK